MTDKEQINCNYKFQDKERFDGKPYCTCFNELCEDISIICDHNCQIYEDYKQLARKTQECEELKKENQNLKNMYNSMSDLCEIKDEAILDKNADIEELSQHCFEYSDRIHNFKQALDEIEIYCKTAKGVATNKNDIEFFKMIIDIINKAKAEEDKQ